MSKKLVAGEHINRQLGRPIGPYVHGVISNGPTLWVAGQVAWGTDGKIVGEDDFETQYRHIMKSIEAVVLDAGGEIRNVCKLVNYVTFKLEKGDPLYGVLGAVRQEFIPADFPSISTLVQVSSLMDPAALVEVDAVVAL